VGWWRDLDFWKHNGISIPEAIKDWNDLSHDDFKFYNLEQFETDPDVALDTLFWNKYPTLTSFFLLQRIDIPLCFQKSKSLHQPTMSTPQVRLITMLMSSGRRNYVLKHYSNALLKLSNFLFTAPVSQFSSDSWRYYYRSLTQFRVVCAPSSLGYYNYFRRPQSQNYTDYYGQSYSAEHYEAKGHLRIQSWLYLEWFKYLPLFSFYVRKVDKLKRKHSRGKSGKYTILWKYVPRYKRFITVLRWFVKDVKFQKSRTFNQRLHRTLEILLFEPEHSLVTKFRNFVHNYVFQNHKKTLLKTLRSVS
jgi:hypothetical protein